MLIAPPVVVESDTIWNVTQGTNITLTCTVVGYPLPNLYWMKEHENTSFEDTIIIVLDDIQVTAQLSIQTSEDDGGKYICYANNSEGTTSTEVDVIIRGSYNSVL